MIFLNPLDVLNKIELSDRLVAADFGSGSGGWVIPLAKKLKMGKVYAIDILQEPLSALKSKLRTERIMNVEVIKSDVEKTSKLLGNSCDMILMTNLLFQIDDKKGVMEEAMRVLKKGGRILAVDWKDDASLGPEKKISINEVKKLAQSAGFEIGKEFSAGVYHWALIMVK